MGYKSIGKRLQMAREEAGYNQEQLAAKIGCSQSTLSNYEKGKRRIYLAQLDKIAAVLNKPLEYFLQPVDDYSTYRSLEHGAVPPFGALRSGGLSDTPPGGGNQHAQVPGKQKTRGDEEMLLASYRSLSPEGKRLVLDFIAWLRVREVNGNG